MPLLSAITRPPPPPPLLPPHPPYPPSPPPPPHHHHHHHHHHPPPHPPPRPETLNVRSFTVFCGEESTCFALSFTIPGMMIPPRVVISLMVTTRSADMTRATSSAVTWWRQK
eukprot:2804292-Pyramimonas_sp.AAC.1